MKRLFAVIRSYGDAWQASEPIEGQVAWDSHASFMNALEGTSDVLLVARAEAPDEIIEQLSADPWIGLGPLSISRVAPWNLRLGSLSRAGGSHHEQS